MRKRILIVDDEKALVDLMSINLAQSGYEPVTACNGEEGFQKIKQKQIDVVLLDHVMEKLDGLGLCKRLKETKNFSKIPIVVCTAHPDMEQNFRQLGIDDYLVKPFDIYTLDKALKRILNRVSDEMKYKKVLIQTDSNTKGIQEAGREMEGLGCRIEFLVIPKDRNLVEEAFRFLPDIVIVDAPIKNAEPQKWIQSLTDYVAFRSLVIIFCMSDEGKENTKDLESFKDRCMTAGAVRYIDSLTRNNVLNVLFENCKQKK